MQTILEKIRLFGNKLLEDHLNGSPFYKKFVSYARKKYGLDYESIEDVWQIVMLSLSDETRGRDHMGKLASRCYDFSEDVPLIEDRISSQWLMNCLVNQCKTYLRNSSSRRKSGDGISLFRISDGEGDSLEIRIKSNREEVSPLQQMIRSEANHRVTDVLHQIRDPYGPMLELFYIHEMSMTDIAKRYNIPEGTVKSRLNTARRLFRERYPADTNVS
jgi:RNA polymerase sigma factor (sigma-70 family)